MKVCFFGTYEKNYPSNRIIIKGLKKNGIDIVECHVSLWEKYRNKHGDFLKLFSLIKLSVNLVIAYLKLGLNFLKDCKDIDTVIVGYIGQLDIFWLNFLILFRKNKPKIIFIPLISLYDTAIVDRGLSGKKNIFAKLLFYLDKYSFKIADLIILDTNEHIDYICDLFNLNKNKFKRVWVGADEDVFYPIGNVIPAEAGIHDYNKNNKFRALFFGKYIPLHGLEYIIKSAKLLENEKDIKFKMIGNGQLYNKITALSKKLNIKNIDFVEWVEYNELVEEINKADVILGIFGGTEKSLRVIPNKVFQAVACSKPVITGNSPAIRELFTDRENILLCENRNPESLRDAILKLKNDVKLEERITSNSYLIFKNNLNSKAIGKEIKDLLLILKNETI
jgi:glycosyltransferase involved in cell wall biosynthesis